MLCELCEPQPSTSVSVVIPQITRFTSDTRLCVACAAVSPSRQGIPDITLGQDGFSPDFSLPWAPPTTPGTSVLGTPLQQAVFEASGLTDFSNLHHPAPGSNTLMRATLDPVTKAPTLVEPATDTRDHVGPPLGFQSYSTNLEDEYMPPGLRSSSRKLDGTVGKPSEAAGHGPLNEPTGSDLSPAVAAPHRRGGNVPQRDANLASMEVWSGAAIYPYASQGIMCQGSDLTIVTSSGGLPDCLHLLGRVDGPQV
jgi:hypothetical protein